MTDYPYKYSIYPDTPVYPKQTFKIPLIFRGSYSVKVVDLSYHQDPKNINYDKLAAAADGFILRGAYGTGVDGKWSGPDPALEEHFWNLHTKRDKPCGLYHFIVAYKTIEDQVKVMLEAVKNKTLLLGRYNDVETEQGADPIKAHHVIDYMKQAEDAMGRFKVYAARWCWQNIMGEHVNDYSDRDLWMAAYTASPDKYIPHGWGDWVLWQFTGTGSMPGYSRAIDISYFKKDKEQFKIWMEGAPMSNKLNIPPLSQQDPLWNKKQLGTSNKTIGSHGCVITNITMMLRFLLGIKITPAELNDWLKANGGYHNANLFVWSILEKYDKRISFTDRDESAALGKIDAQLAKGLPVLVNVDMNPSTPALDEHWVLVKGKVAGSYIINDPWTGEEIEFEKLYGDPKTGVRIVCTYDFEGAPVPPTDPEPEPEVLFRVKVLINDLVIRSGAGKLYPVVYRYASGEYGILEVKKDAFSGAEYGRIGVNRWISLDPTYVRKLDSNTQSIEERITNLEARVTVLEKNK